MKTTPAHLAVLIVASMGQLSRKSKNSNQQKCIDDLLGEDYINIKADRNTLVTTPQGNGVIDAAVKAANLITANSSGAREGGMKS